MSGAKDVSLVEDEMEFQPSLYIRRSDLPPNVTMSNILANVEHVHGPSFIGIQHKLYLHIICPKITLAKKIQVDGIDMGQNLPKIRVYNVIQHNAWLDDELDK